MSKKEFAGWDVVDFHEQTFHDIPKQDNPAFGDDKCLMIIKANNTCPHVLVLSIIPNPIDSVTSIAKFWEYKRAMEYVKLLTATQEETNHK